MNLTNKGKFSNDTKKQLQSNFLSLIKENVMNEIPDLKEDDYENIENSVINSFDTETQKPVTEIGDVTLDDIVEVKENSDNNTDDIQDLTESQVFDKLYKYIMESQKTDDIKKEIIKESIPNKNKELKESKTNKINKETSNRRLKTKMSILDRKRRKYIKESLNKMNKKRLTENEIPQSGFGDDALNNPNMDQEMYKEKYPDIFEGLKDKSYQDLYGNINKNIDDAIEQQYDFNLKKDEHIDFYDFIKMENLGNEFTCYEFVSNLEENEIEDLRKYLSSNILREQDEDDESGIDELFDEEPKKDQKKDKELKEDKPDSKPKDKQDNLGLDKDQKKDKESKEDKKESKDKDSKEDELIKKVKELRPELKSKDVKVKMDKKLTGPVNGFTFEVVDDKNKSVSNFIVIETGPKEEKKEENPEDKVAGSVEESSLFESKRRKGKRTLKEQDIDSVVQKVQQQVEEYLDGEKEKISTAIDGAVNKDKSVQPAGEVDMSEENNIPEDSGNQSESPEQTENIEQPTPTQNESPERKEQEQEKQEPKEENKSEEESEDASLDDIFSGLEEEEPTKESENLDDDDMLFEGIFDEDELVDDEPLQDESDENYLKESFFRIFDLGSPSKKQVQKKSSPKDYSPKGQEEQTKKYIGTQEMKFPTENSKQKAKENKMEKAMTDLKEIF